MTGHGLTKGCRRHGRAIVLSGLGATAALALAAPALAAPVATSDASYDVLGRVFPDPLAGCAPAAPTGCDPNAQGNVPAAQFIQFGEFTNALEYMNSVPEWQRYLEVQVLDGELGANGTGQGVADSALGVESPGSQVFPGNNQPLEYDPKPQYRSAGLATNAAARSKSDLIVLRVTDESVPDAGKKRYALSLSIHGIERAGVEGGTRAMEDLVTAATTGRSAEPVVLPDPENPAASPSTTFEEVLRESIIYFTYPNPDGWRRGSVSEGGFFFQRYNGNGVDVNRDWPDIGFSFRPYSGLSEPESRGLSAYLEDVESNGGEFALGDDLHGQPSADALSYTLLPHGSHDFAKDQRIRSAAISIHRASEAALQWSPIVQPNDAPQGGGAPCVPGALGDTCAQIYGQTWGTVYDTINYTTTGALGDYFDSSIGVDADGIDNEMSFSHLDKNIVFEPQTEQLHVAGNKALIFARLAELVTPRSYAFEPGGTQGYVPNLRLTREQKSFDEGPPPGAEAQADIDDEIATIGPEGTVVFPFEVKRGPQGADGSPDANKNIFNGGLRVDVRTQNIQGVGTGIAHLAVQCRGCDEHPGVADGEWVTVSEDYNQSPAYAQAGVTVAVNRPQPGHTGGPVEWRAVLSGNAVGVGLPASPTAVAGFSIDYTRGPASTDGATGGDDPAGLSAYDVANTDFFPALNDYIDVPGRQFQAIDPAAVISGRQSLTGLRSLVLADSPLPGYTGDFGASSAPSGGPTADQAIASQAQTLPGAGSGAPGTFEEFPFTIGPNDENAAVRVRIEWGDSSDDFDLYLLRVEDNGDRTEVASSAQGGTAAEELQLENPGAGDYVVRVDNFAAADPAFTGTIDFSGAAPDTSAGTGLYTVAEKNAWIDALEQYVRGGGNLVLTDGALEALPGLTADSSNPIPASAIERQTVYVGQTTFDRSAAAGDETVADPLAEGIDQEGARFNSANRRQMFEPTPLGFSIQNQESGADESNARQYEVDRAAWEAAGGRTAGTSADAGERDAAAVYDEVTLGELPLGNGRIRIAGALLPQPSEEFDHPLGLEPFAVTYTGYIVLCNLLDCTVRSQAEGDGAVPPGGTAEPEPSGPCANDLVGGKRNDRLRGTSGSDRLAGKGGRDRLNGRGGADCVRGGTGKDRLKGGSGRDRLNGGRGADRIKAGSGRDIVRAARGGPDKIDCGPGRDKAFIKSAKDRVRRCEKVKRR